MSKKKNPKDSRDENPHLGNWAKRPPVLTQKSIAENALSKIRDYRKGRRYELIPHPTIPRTFIEKEVPNEFNWEKDKV